MRKDESAPAAWAIRKVMALCGIPEDGAGAPDAAITAFARYVEANEPPPPDPLLNEAREVIAQVYESIEMPFAAQAARLGKSDRPLTMRITLQALRRGIALAGTPGDER
jgi:hypothetical protein